MAEGRGKREGNLLLRVLFLFLCLGKGDLTDVEIK